MTGYGRQRDQNNTVSIAADLIFIIPGQPGRLRSSRELSVVPVVGLYLTDILDQDRELDELRRPSWIITAVHYSLWMKCVRVFARLDNFGQGFGDTDALREAMLTSCVWDPA